MVAGKMINTAKRADLFTLLINLSLLLTLAAVVLSAYIRLKSVGIGCDDWPACYAQLSLLQKPSAMPTSLAGAIHRITATLLGLLVMTVTYMAFRRRGTIGTGLAVPLLAFALIIFLSILGFNTPTWQIPAVALGNLTGGMALAALLWWMSLRWIAGNITTSAAEILFRPWVLLGLVIVSLQIALGSWVSANFAAAVCPELFTCKGDWASMSSLAQGLDITRRIAMNDAERIIFDSTQPALNMAHRIGAILTLLYIGVMAIKTSRLHHRLHVISFFILVLLVAQVGLGVTSVLNEMPLLLVTAHNAVAALLLLTVVNLLHLLTPTSNHQQKKTP